MSADLATDAPGEAQQSIVSAVPGPPGKTSGMAPLGPLSRLPAVPKVPLRNNQHRCVKSSFCLYSNSEGWRVPTHPCHPTSRTHCGWVTYYLPRGRQETPSPATPGDAAAWVGGTWGAVTGQPGSSTDKVRSVGTVPSFQGNDVLHSRTSRTRS